MLKSINVLLVGVGPHADKVYLPALHDLHESMPVTLKVIVDLKSAKPDVEKRLAKHGFSAQDAERHYVEDVANDYELSDTVKGDLDQLRAKHDINAVIISTDPLAHKGYALWALKNDLPILMDKPVSARIHTSHDTEEAAGIFEDYLELEAAYANSKAPLFTVNSQRRYHPGFDLVFDKVADILERFNCPVTAIQCTHADGQWRMPEEIITQRYHPYNIYGKISHGGYHFIDTVSRLIRLSYGNSSPRSLTEIRAITSFVKPQGLLKQLTQDDYAAIFGDKYHEASTHTTEELRELYEGFGEVDVASIMQLVNGDDVVGNITLNLMHNSFARRSWLPPGEDLYKGNGRVKQEYFSIQQGPFQNIQIHSYQKNDRHETSDDSDYDLGGNNHFDIYIFRNKDITGDKEALEVISMRDLAKQAQLSEKRYIHDQIKHRVPQEFFNYLLGNIDKHDLISPFETHRMSAMLMSLIYRAGASDTTATHALDDSFFANT